MRRNRTLNPGEGHGGSVVRLRHLVAAAGLCCFVSFLGCSSDEGNNGNMAGCGAGLLQCNGVCVNPALDGLNCGNCGVVCPGGHTCQGGACVASTCMPGLALCAGTCTDINTAQNCGNCGVMCGAGQLCQAGICTSVTSTAAGAGGGTTSAGPSTTGFGGTMASSTVGGVGGMGGATVSSTMGGMGGSMGMGGATGAGGSTNTSADERPWFSFFVTSLPALREECGQDGCGGDLGGLSGADQICTKLAQQGNPGDGKTWKAFLSTTGMYGDLVKEDAIDRIGQGPWWDWHGRMLAPDIGGLMDDRPTGGDAALRVMFTDETGVDIQSARNGDGNDNPDNHDTLTGSGKDGRLSSLDGDDGATGTCLDWTSVTEVGESTTGDGPDGGEVPVGHAWPRQPGATSGIGSHWIQDHSVNGCEPSVDVDGGAGACPTCNGVGDGGGYGAFFCFALDATAPPQ